MDIQQSTSFQNYNVELAKCSKKAKRSKKRKINGLQDLREKRDIVHRQILEEEKEKAQVQRELAALTEKLHRLNESIQQKVQGRNDYDKTIQETESAYNKVDHKIYCIYKCISIINTFIFYIQILESSQTLLHVLKRETQNLQKKRSNQQI
ncbi:13 KDA deflagellation-inducible protein [Reticulomyxa filosa]|uniref:13 kDa deflagellation-inducible protein n=1 Tax=Reticulomyxa filosa TaxID=46433 RepID=X6PFP5_RETFI|nr:13 KDA deflagellation-inducible protein [Reticulomyxa filosa]|eukprot:ETO36898.1 13 KDA deflagellation-inducible protein [Reticulomyxa filosa]